MSNKYVEIAIGHPKNRGIIVPLNYLTKYIKPDTALFKSYYLYDEEAVKHFEIRKTIKNFKGIRYFNKVILDIDKGVNSDEKFLNDVRTLIFELDTTLKIPLDIIQPWFSGRGFHIILPDIFGFEPATNLSKIVHATLVHYFPLADNVYDNSRLIRVGFTPNEKTQHKYFKTPFTPIEVYDNNMDWIRSHSEEPRTSFVFNSEKVEKPLLKIIKSPQKIRIEKNNKSFQPTLIATCLQRMYDEGDIEGSRHNKIMRMTSYFRRNGIPLPATIAAMIDWCKSMNPYEVEKYVNDIYERGYRYGCSDKLMDRYCSPKCVYYAAKQTGADKLPQIITSKEMETQFVNKIRKDIRKSSFDLNKIYTLDKSFLFEPGELVIILGDTGMGKTAFIQNLCTNIDLNSLWLSLEMNIELMYRRFIQIAHKMSKEEVISRYMEADNTWAEAIQHIDCVAVSPGISQIRRLVAEIKPKILVIDTIDCIKVSKYIHDSMFKIDSIIEELRSIASMQDIIVIGICHIPKSASSSSTLNVHSGKHSSTIADKSDVVIGIEGKQDNPLRVVRSLKARDKAPFRIVCKFKSKTMQFIQEL